VAIAAKVVEKVTKTAKRGKTDNFSITELQLPLNAVLRIMMRLKLVKSAAMEAITAEQRMAAADAKLRLVSPL
jgi:hypothetical protein